MTDSRPTVGRYGTTDGTDGTDGRSDGTVRYGPDGTGPVQSSPVSQTGQSGRTDGTDGPARQPVQTSTGRSDSQHGRSDGRSDSTVGQSTAWTVRTVRTDSRYGPVRYGTVRRDSSTDGQSVGQHRYGRTVDSTTAANGRSVGFGRSRSARYGWTVR